MLNKQQHQHPTTTHHTHTLPETNSEFTPENGWLEDDPFLWGQKAYFQVLLLLVSGRVGMLPLPSTLPKTNMEGPKMLGLGKGNGTLFKMAIFCTLPETNIAPENMPSQKGISSSNHQFSGVNSLLVSGRVTTWDVYKNLKSIIGKKLSNYQPF